MICCCTCAAKQTTVTLVSSIWYCVIKDIYQTILYNHVSYQDINGCLRRNSYKNEEIAGSVSSVLCCLSRSALLSELLNMSSAQTHLLKHMTSQCKCPIKLQNQTQPGVAKVITLIPRLWHRILVCHIKGNTISSQIRIYDFFTSQ